MNYAPAGAVKNIKTAAERKINMVQLDQIKYELNQKAENIKELGVSL